MDPQTKVEKLPGIGKYYAFKLQKLGIETLEDLIYHFPFRYDDFSQSAQIQNLTPGEKISITGTVWQIKNVRTRTGKFLTNATVADDSGTINVIWFNQPYLTQNIKPGTPISLSGKVEKEGNRCKMLSPQYEIIKTAISSQPQTLHTGRLVPIYPETEGISSKWLRAKVANLTKLYLEKQDDFMPEQILKRQKLQNLGFALEKIHYPDTYQDVEVARKRLSFDELFFIQYLSAKRKIEWGQIKKAPKLKIDEAKIKTVTQSLPFTLTLAQQKALDQILADLKRETPANRLLEGDVGSGKTIVAAIAAYCAFLNGYDVLLAAPTEILTFQHQKTLETVLSPFGVEVGTWTKSKKTKGHIVCGTHALLTSFEAQRPVGLVIVDEQHRFGVAQRSKLFLDQSQKITPHLLTMTATPIPRTLALTLYGDLDLSVLDQMPTGRQKISTFVVPNFKRQNAYKFIEKEVTSGRQAFILTPFVEPSETMQTVKSATLEFEKLKKSFGKKVKLGLLHGRLKSKDKEKVIDTFKANKIQILVCTPVVEVGIDVPNATIMLIESSERFGLAQLHQLRGRVGRGEFKSYCFLFTDSHSETSQKRLKSMEKVHVGFELAEIDLKMRGPGEVFGFKQSGYASLKIADLSDHVTIAAAQKEAKGLLLADPNLKNHKLLAQKIEEHQLDYIQPN